MYNYKSLKDTPYSVITECFNLAFSDYAMPIKFTEEQIINRLKMSGYNKELSFGAFANEEMVGFIFNSCNTYNNEKVVFDIGTGIVPEHRGKKVFSSLFKFAEQELKKQNTKKYYLEVLQGNDKAIGIYKKLGFTVVREYSVLKSTNGTKQAANHQVQYVEFDRFNLESAKHCAIFKPSYEHSTDVLYVNPELYNASFIKKENERTAFCIFAKDTGSIMQLGFTDKRDLQIIIEQLLIKYQSIVAKNIDRSYLDILDILKSLGFIEVTTQYEMVKII